MDPDRLFWQRNESAPNQNSSRQSEEITTTETNRPPSYISDDGVGYVLEATPRSIAPVQDVPLPPHPSERRR